MKISAALLLATAFAIAGCSSTAGSARSGLITASGLTLSDCQTALDAKAGHHVKMASYDTHTMRAAMTIDPTGLYSCSGYDADAAQAAR